MDATAIRVAEKEDRERGIDQQHVLHRVVLFRAAITVRLRSSVLGADDAPFRPVMGKRGDAGAAVGPAATGAGSSTNGVITAVTLASTAPRRRAKAARERVGASPRVRSTASSAGKSTWIH
jgi:hypothetical protein